MKSPPENGPIYLDYQAGTPVDSDLLHGAVREVSSHAGNPSSHHWFGERGAEFLDDARDRIAAFFGVSSGEVVLTSGATESVSLAILGISEHLFAETQTPRILASRIEHAAVLRSLEVLASRGADVHYLTHSSDGSIDLNEVEDELRNGIDLVTVMLANNEIGTIFPIPEISELSSQYEAIFHCDASQGLQENRDLLLEANIGMVSFSGHKVYGLAGSGGLIVRRELQPHISPLVMGGGQERGLRPGTQNVLGSVVLGLALERLSYTSESDRAAIRSLQENLHERLLSASHHCSLIGPPVDERLLGNLMVSFEGVEAEMLVANCPDLAMSTGSACSSGTPGVSHVLRALPLEAGVAEGAIRIGIGRYTAADEIIRAAETITAAVAKVSTLLRTSQALA